MFTAGPSLVGRWPVSLDSQDRSQGTMMIPKGRTVWSKVACKGPKTGCIWSWRNSEWYNKVYCWGHVEPMGHWSTQMLMQRYVGALFFSWYVPSGCHGSCNEVYWVNSSQGGVRHLTCNKPQASYWSVRESLSRETPLADYGIPLRGTVGQLLGEWVPAFFLETPAFLGTLQTWWLWWQRGISSS